MAVAPSQAEVLLAASRALWEVPTPRLRAVAVAWDERFLYPRFLYGGPPWSEDERELVATFATHLVADFAAHAVEESAELVPCPSSLTLRSGEHWGYLRHEQAADDRG